MQLKLSFLPEGGRYGGRIAIEAPGTMHDRLKQIPGYNWSNTDRISTIPRAWPAVLSLGTVAKEARMSLVPDEEVLAWYKHNSAEWKAMREKAVLLGEGLKEEGLSYYPHQIAGAEWLLLDSELQGRGLLDQTGSGKTGTIIAAIQIGKLCEKGPVLITCPESVMGTGWYTPLGRFAPELRVVEITGTPTQRRKKFEAIKAGEFDVAIIGYSNLRTHTRFEAFPGRALRRCIKCGGPRLTTGQVDDKGNPLPDIEYHTTSVGDRDYGTGSQALCTTRDCGWQGTLFMEEGHSEKAVAEADKHAGAAGRKVKEVTVAQCQTHMKDLNEIEWSLIVADEVHHAMNAHSQTTQALWGVAKYAPSKPRRWAATGTIISTHVDQAWAILHFMDPEAWPVKSKWVSWYCNADYNWAGFWEVLGLKENRKEEFQTTFAACTRRVLKEQVLQLPPKLRWGSLERRLTMSGEQLRVYTEMKEEMLALVEEGTLTAQNAMVQVMKLSMLASGTGYPLDGDSSQMGLKVPSVKVDAIIADWKAGEWEGEQIGMLFSSRRALRMAEQAFYEAKLITPDTVCIIAGDVPKQQRDWQIDDFQAGKRRVAMLTYAAGGEGITLTAASTVVMFERNWSPIKNSQGEDRFHRIGSERHQAIVYRDYVVQNSNEVRQLQQLAEHGEELESLVKDQDKLRSLIAG